MAISTKTGDQGLTSLYNGKQVSKSDPSIEALGEIDELSSFIGLVRGKINNKEEKRFLIIIQKDLYKIMAVLAGKYDPLTKLKKNLKIIERLIEEKEKKLPKIKRFLLPGETSLSSWFHILRSICRRGERKVVGYLGKKELKNKKIIFQYLNRLSDWFFIMARNYQKKEILV